MDLSKLQIRNMTIADLETIQTDFEKNFPNLWHSAIWKEELGHTNSSYFVLSYADEIVCFGGIKQIFDEADLMNIVTKKEKQNKGFASLLLQHIFTFAQKNGCHKITLEVSTCNTSAIHLYEKYGFTQIALRPHYYQNGDDAIIMALSL